ncbi:hypothetical protein Q2470_29110, partial [Pseudomonas aeruginosa]|nr:hypothetical protein [Pseudomonas aeruginosa]
RMEARRGANGGQTGYQNRFVLPAETGEREVRDAGFVGQKHLDFIPLYHMWRGFFFWKEKKRAPLPASPQHTPAAPPPASGGKKNPPVF